MKISLIIPAYNEEKYIGDCLQSVLLYGQKIFEVIVVNNGSTDKTTEIAEKFLGLIQNLKIISEPKKGLPQARNRGIRESSGDIVAYIDADCRLRDSWCDEIINNFNLNNNLVALSGSYKYYDLNFFSNIIARINWWIFTPMAYYLTGYIIIFGNVAIRREFLLKIGGVREEVVFYGDDTDLAKRLHPHGKITYKMNFYLYSSSRRVKKEGLFKLYIKYGINFLWEVLWNKPLTEKYIDVR